MIWRTTMYIHTNFNAYFCIYKPFFRNYPKKLIFRVIAHGFSVSEHPKSFSKRFIRTFIMSWRTTTYTHTIFNAYLRIYKPFFNELSKILNFLCVIAYKSGSSKHLKKIYEDFCMSCGTTTYNEMSFNAYFRIYKPFYE